MTSTCAGCGATIHWQLTAHDRWQPIDADGTPHYATCRNADAFRPDRPGHTQIAVERLPCVHCGRATNHNISILSANVKLARCRVCRRAHQQPTTQAALPLRTR